jgi:hypothetical protein
MPVVDASGNHERDALRYSLGPQPGQMIVTARQYEEIYDGALRETLRDAAKTMRHALLLLPPGEHQTKALDALQDVLDVAIDGLPKREEPPSYYGRMFDRCLS